jgi:hypothetical protein
VACWLIGFADASALILHRCNHASSRSCLSQEPSLPAAAAASAAAAVCSQVYVDCTLGAGGHMEGMMQQHPVSLRQEQAQQQQRQRQLQITAVLCSAVSSSLPRHPQQLSAGRRVPLVIAAGGLRAGCEQQAGTWAASCASYIHFTGQLSCILVEVTATAHASSSANRQQHRLS